MATGYGFVPGRLSGLLLAVLLVFSGAGCVTNTDSVFTSPPAPEDELERRVALARQYIGERDWENAKRNLAHAVEIDERDAEVHEAFALVYQSTGEKELAEKSFIRAIKLDREFSRARNNYAAFLFGEQRYAEAEAQLEFVVRDSLYGARPLSFVNLGLCRLQLDKFDGAEEAFVRALSMDRTNPIALLELASLRYEAGDYAAANRHYGIYRTLVRPQPARALWLGIRLARAMDDRDSEGSYAMALTNLYPDSTESRNYRRIQRNEQ
ncbi:type IV pilus biogenesis/stability protein PilW [Kineobactrum sediminis]|uniref:Type IV pilus biogenesis/stability protein PilW n=1 Tax=Kineobactrum sediminis TaxID=1905677 RepID=A0A2N5XYZ1_9GAMM|nr:type IV pilus biogenesis/stability protein PilW [Kineobactrum sediminis]PLW81339.1 type IV pilus biogenesis/stability protein PilW [Kineobactrum sediminis]